MKVTPEKKAAFCAALATTGGNVTRACEAIDVARLTAYRWREDDPEFSEAWDRAKAVGLEALEDEAMRRALEGTEKPVFHQGLECGTIREYSDTLAIFLLKGGKPEKYRERVSTELTGKDGGPVVVADGAKRAARLAALVKLAEVRKALESDDIA